MAMRSRTGVGRKMPAPRRVETDFGSFQMDDSDDLATIVAMIDNEVNCLYEEKGIDPETGMSVLKGYAESQVSWQAEEDLMSSHQGPRAKLVSTWASGVGRSRQSGSSRRSNTSSIWDKTTGGVGISASSPLSHSRDNGSTWRRRLGALEGELSMLRDDIDCLDTALENVDQLRRDRPRYPSFVPPGVKIQPGHSTNEPMLDDQPMMRSIERPMGPMPPKKRKQNKSNTKPMRQPRTDAGVPKLDAGFDDLRDLLEVIENQLHCEAEPRRSPQTVAFNRRVARVTR